MCWQIQDILYDKTPSNNADYAYKSYTPTAQELANLRRWKAVDYLLYDTFNKSLWRKIAAQVKPKSHFLYPGPGRAVCGNKS